MIGDEGDGGSFGVECFCELQQLQRRLLQLSHGDQQVSAAAAAVAAPSSHSNVSLPILLPFLAACVLVREAYRLNLE